MQKQLRQWTLLALFAPALVCAQDLSNQQRVAPDAAPMASTASTVVSIDAQKKVAIKALLAAIEADKLAAAIGSSAQMQAKQLVPAILSDALAENTKLKDEQKRALVPQLQQNTVPKLVTGAGKVFETPKFREDAITAQTQAYAKYYTTEQIRDLTKFYLSPTGRQFIKIQDQVGRDVIHGLLQKYMPMAIKSIRTQADKEVATAKPAAAPAKKK